ncbi:hypothetical protein AX16_009857 [Volvariella volvacea WC 439]|nr:hypothetical protein AX16_009857 [Volvariella volvacea WC 439]
MSRPTSASPDRPNISSSSPTSSPTSPNDNRADISQPSSASPRRMSKDSEGYPSWLPERPPPPAPTSTYQSSLGVPEPGPSEPSPFFGGRKPTPRSVRIVSLQDNFAEKNAAGQPGNQPRNVRHSHARAWSRATAASISHGLFSSADPFLPKAPQPKFNAKGLNLELLRNPSVWSHIYFYLFPILVFFHIPLQSFFDFNAVFILVQVSRYPNPQAPGVPGSGRNWALGAAAYIACWAAWLLVVVLMYETVYSFIRRWRVKRPTILPIYLSSSAFNLACMTSYTNFCFFQHLRWTAFFDSEHGSFRDGLSETFWFYSQNLPTVALLLPRAGLSLALLFSFSSAPVGLRVLTDAGIRNRDSTYFRSEDGALTAYARGVLIANAVWTAWRILVLLCSWLGLWIVSGQGCAGLCGPRYRWEEEEAEKTRSVISDNASDNSVLPWSWKECTKQRIQLAFEFCLTNRPSSRQGSLSRGAGGPPKSRSGGDDEGAPPFENMERVFAAVGLPSSPPTARRGVLSEKLFEVPTDRAGRRTPIDLADVLPTTSGGKNDEGEIVVTPVAEPPLIQPAPVKNVPYPFTTPGAAQLSSKDKIPFPPSPSRSKKSKKSGSSGDGSGGTPCTTSGGSSGSGGSAGESSGSRSRDDHDNVHHAHHHDEDEEMDVQEDVDEDDDGFETNPSLAGRASDSISSLGQPISATGGNTRYPFQFRRPTSVTAGYGRGLGSSSISSGAAPSHASHAHTRSTQSGVSGVSGYTHTTQSTGNRESSDSHSPRSHTTSSFSGHGPVSPLSVEDDASSHDHPYAFTGSPIPMPPRHPQPAHGRGRGRVRAGTLPVTPSQIATAGSSVAPSTPSPSVAPSPVAFPRASASPSVVHPHYRAYAAVGAGSRIRTQSGFTEATTMTRTSEFDIDLNASDLEHMLDDTEIYHGYEHGVLQPHQRPPRAYGDERHGSRGGEEADRESVGESEGGGHGEQEDVVGLLSPSVASSSPRASFISLQARGGRGGNGSRTQSHSSGSSSRSRTSSIGMAARSRANSLAVSVRSRTQSLMQGIGAASQSSLEAVRDAVGARTRANSSMARLEEDATVPYMSTSDDNAYSPQQRDRQRFGAGVVSSSPLAQGPARGYGPGITPMPPPPAAVGAGRRIGMTHTRDASATSGGSGSMSGMTSMSSGNENYTFGHPIKPMWLREQEERERQERRERRQREREERERERERERARQREREQQRRRREAQQQQSGRQSQRSSARSSKSSEKEEREREAATGTSAPVTPLPGASTPPSTQGSPSSAPTSLPTPAAGPGPSSPIPIPLPPREDIILHAPPSAFRPPPSQQQPAVAGSLGTVTTTTSGAPTTHADISTAAQSFVTVPAGPESSGDSTLNVGGDGMGTTPSAVQVGGVWGGMTVLRGQGGADRGPA